MDGGILIVFFSVVVVVAAVMLWQYIVLINRVVLTIVAVVLLLFSLSMVGANRAAFREMKFAQEQYNKCSAAYSGVQMVALHYQDYLLEHGALVLPDEPDEVTVYGPLPVRTIGLTQWRGKPLEMRHTTAHEYSVMLKKREATNVDP